MSSPGKASRLRIVTSINDTHPDVERLQLEGWRRMSPAEKLQRVADLNAGVRQLAEARIRAEHPDYSDAEVRLELARLWLPRELFEVAQRHAAKARAHEA